MTLDDIKREFASQVKLRGFDDKYIDKAEEKEIIQLAIAKGISFESARSSLQQVCEQQGYQLESGVMKEAKNLLEVHAEQLGLISGTAEEINITVKGRQAAERAKSIFKAGQSV